MRCVRSAKTERVVEALLACSDVECMACPFQNKKNTPRGCFAALAKAAVKELQRLEARGFLAVEQEKAQKSPKVPNVTEEVLEHLRAGCSVLPISSLRFKPDERFPRVRLPGSNKTYVIFPASPGEKEKEETHDET